MSEPWICPACGKTYAQPPDVCECGAIALRVVGNKKKKIVILLALFLGWMGAHRFYLGQPFKGALYLLFFWTLVPFFFSLIDIGEYIFTNPYNFNVKYNKLVPASIPPDDMNA